MSSPDPSVVPVSISRASRRFGDRQVLDGVSMQVDPGQIHALIGPNGAGKTTLLRMVCGLVEPEAGRVLVVGQDVTSRGVDARRHIGFVPSGDRTFYLRLSGVENLVFFGRLHGLRRGAARERALAAIRDVDLTAAADQPVGTYSHGMHKRLSVARALLARPQVLVIDEATHDLDPVNARLVQDLVARAADDGTAVIWATQRLEELRGFARRVTVLVAGRVRFQGTVHELAALAVVRHYVLRLGDAAAIAHAVEHLPPGSTLAPAPDLGAEHAVLVLAVGQTLGQVLGDIVRGGVAVLGCTEERSPIESAFLTLSRGPSATQVGS